MWMCEHEQVNMIESFIKSFINVNKIFLSMKDKIFDDMEN
jgi:hypothetical protein